MARRKARTLQLVESIAIPARRGRAAEVRKGQCVRVVNVHGTQVVDCWAFNRSNPGEFMSMEHSRVTLGRYRPKVGDRMVTNLRRPILRLLEDTSPGVHDTMMAACDRYRYELLGHQGYHDNCTDNLWEAMVALRHKPPETPCPFNLWQNTPVGEDGEIQQLPTVSRRGDHVLLRAEMDLVICLSCCPQDIMPINGMKPRGARFEILD
jgi:uncharacterized protein YcgI (DUF1989 family)